MCRELLSHVDSLCRTSEVILCKCRSLQPEPEQSYSSSVCNSATANTNDFTSEFLSTLRNRSDGSDIGALENLINFMNAGQLLANASTAINLTEAKTILGAMQNQLSSDISASSGAFSILANSINFTAIGQILTNLNSNMSSSNLAMWEMSSTLQLT